MKTKKISEADANVLCSRDEDHFFDRKARAVSGRKVQKIAVALANADGGDFVIGIKDDVDEPIPADRWDGASKIEDFNSHLQAISDITPSLQFEYTILTCDAKPGYVINVQVDKGSSVHHTADKTRPARIKLVAG